MINFKNYKKNLNKILEQRDLEKHTNILFNEIKKTWKMNKNFFICGNGGSGANAIHIANDFLYGAGITNKKGLKVEYMEKAVFVRKNWRNKIPSVIHVDGTAP